MGSSKKHKERDREREHKRKHKHRSRSRSRSPREKKRRHRDRSHSRDKEIGYSKDVEGRSEIYEEELKIKEEPSDDIKPKCSGGDISLSIEETNKLRAKLGLKPLEIPDENEPKEEKESLKDDIHKPAGNIAQAQMTEKLKEKLAVIKEKRRINMQLGKVKTLGESDSDDESAATWVKRNRKDAEEKKMAEKRAKMLEEMDAEFGIGNLVEEEFAPLMNKGKEYTSRDLKGIKVEHGMGSFKEGKAVILTLKDKGILDEDDEGDTLVNVNIVDDERSKKNVENKKKKPDYKPWDEPEYDEYGMLKTTNILDKYDEEIDGEKRDAFTLGSGGKYDGEHEKNMEKIRAQLRQQGQSLSLAAPNIASEYYTQEEMDAKFKKVKKKVRKIRKKMVKADDLLPLEDEMPRSRNKRGTNEDNQEIIPQESEWGAAFMSGMGQVQSTEDMEVDKSDFEDAAILGPDDDLSSVPVEEDAADVELQLALERTRKLKQKKKKMENPDNIAEKIIAQRGADTNSAGVAGSIVLNSTSEFCRTLGDIPTYGQSGNREEDKDELGEFESELLEQRKRREEEEEEKTNRWEEVAIDTQPVEIKEEEKVVLDDEPTVDKGLAAALQLSVKKGFLVHEVAKKLPTSKLVTEMEAQNYSIEDKRFDDIDEKYKKRDRFYNSGIVTEFKEKESYKPDVKIEYVDDKGRSLDSKEAFRQLSHRFHGKGSGKRKQEKRSKKMEEDELMKQMSSTDTPLHTLTRLIEKQEREKTPYILLSGSKHVALTKPSQ